MEFLNGVLLEVSRHKLKSSQTRVFVFFSILIFHFYKMLFTNRLEFSCFADFLYVFIKADKSLVFFKNPPVESLWKAWSKRLESFFKLMSKNSMSEFVLNLKKFQLKIRRTGMHVISTVCLLTCNLCQPKLLCVEFLALELRLLLLPKNVLSLTERVKADKHCIMTGVYTEVRFS